MKNNNKQKFMYSGKLENYQLSNQIKNVMQYEANICIQKSLLLFITKKERRGRK